MQSVAAEQTQTPLARKVVATLLSVALAAGSLTLVGCGGNKQEQDNCYGEDMPVINE